MDNAVAELRESLRLDPHDPWANFNFGIILSNEGQNDAARECFQQAVEVDPEFANAHFNLANAEYKLRRFDSAIGAGGR